MAAIILLALLGVVLPWALFWLICRNAPMMEEEIDAPMLEEAPSVDTYK